MALAEDDEVLETLLANGSHERGVVVVVLSASREVRSDRRSAPVRSPSPSSLLPIDMVRQGSSNTFLHRGSGDGVSQRNHHRAIALKGELVAEQ